MDTEYQIDMKTRILEEKYNAAIAEREYWELRTKRLKLLTSHDA